MADIEIDPFDADHAMFVTGYGLWASRNLTAFDRGENVDWWFKNTGLEETVPLALVSPPQGAPSAQRRSATSTASATTTSTRRRCSSPARA